MPKIKSPESFQPNVVLTASDLQNHVDGSYPLPGFITEQAAIDAVSGDDTLIIHDDSVSQLRKVTLNQVFLNPFPIVTNSVTGTAGSNLSITSQTGRSINITSGDSIAFNSAGTIGLNNNVSITGTLDISGKVTASGTGALKIPVGTTAQRPSTPVAGDIRYNSTNDQAEVYSGTEWKAVGGSPFDASGGTVTTIDGYKIHTFTVSGFFTPAANVEGKVEVLVVGGGGGGGYFDPHSGGGGGGDVKFSVVNIPKNTSPISIVVGTGGAVGVGGTFSVFGLGNITSSGGAAGGGYSGGSSGSGLAGTTGNFGSGGGGGGGARTASAYMFLGGGVGGEGFGSSISGTLKKYGGGGGGAGSTYGTNTNYPGLGLDGGGRGAYSGNSASTPEANSGAGGGGGAGRHGRAATAGADGIVIVRYRVA